MIHALLIIALSQLLPHQPRHHRLDPLLADDRVSGIGNGDVVLEVDAVEGGRDRGLLGQEGGGFGSRHFPCSFFVGRGGKRLREVCEVCSRGVCFDGGRCAEPGEWRRWSDDWVGGVGGVGAWGVKWSFDNWIEARCPGRRSAGRRCARADHSFIKRRLAPSRRKSGFSNKTVYLISILILRSLTKWSSLTLEARL